MTTTLELRATNGEANLAGSLHRPDDSRATVLMIPGSGPADRDNDVYFPSIRAGVLDRGIAVASFDKRGVGGSTGDWRAVGPAEQAADVAAQLTCLNKTPGVDPARIGLFGHSQGGWVVLEAAAADPSLAFVITNSGPGVTMACQERFATEAHMSAGGAPAEAVAGALATQDALMALVRDGADFETVQAIAGGDGPGPRDAAELDHVRRWLDHDPRPALERLTSPLLAIFGDEDLNVPVGESIAVFRAARAGRPGGLDIVTLPGADHRLQSGDPPAFHPAYEPMLGDWIASKLAVGTERKEAHGRGT
jgi:pimeloyl-ACP methyl ester carboxylesterase